MNHEHLLIKNIKKRVHQDSDIVILITGDEGTGKSTLMQVLGFNLDTNFDQIKNIAYIPSPESIIKKFNELKPFSVFGIDEGTEVFYKMDFMKSFQTMLVKMYKRERKQNKISIICMPTINDLTGALKNSRVRLWIHIVERGIGVIMCRSPSPYAKDPWDLQLHDQDFRKKFIKKKYASITTNDLLVFLESRKTYLDTIEWAPLSQKKFEIYRQQGGLERKKYYEEHQKNIDSEKWKTRTVKLIKIMKDDCSYDYKELGILLNLAPQHIGRLYKEGITQGNE